MMTPRANWRAVCTAQAASIGPSRRWTCQSSGRRIESVVGRDMMFSTLALGRAPMLIACMNALKDAIVFAQDRKSTRLNSSHTVISYAVFCLKKKKKHSNPQLANAAEGDVLVLHNFDAFCDQRLSLFSTGSGNFQDESDRPVDVEAREPCGLV